MHIHWLTIQDKPIIVSRYGDILCEPEKELDRIAGLLGIERKGKLDLPKDKLDRTGWGDIPTDHSPRLTAQKMDKNYYLDRHFMEHYDKDDMEYINKAIDPRLRKIFVEG